MAEAGLRAMGVGRRRATDPLFTAGDTFCHRYTREGVVDIDDEQLCHQVVAAFPCEVLGCKESFSSLLEFEMHYNSRHRFVCSQCKKQLPTAHLLDLHLSETHDSFFAAQAARKPMYRCFVEDCCTVSQGDKERRSHCIEVHSFPHDFRYDQSLKKKKSSFHQQKSSNGNSGSDSMVVDEEVQEKKNHPVKQFTFGQSKQGRTFCKNTSKQQNRKGNSHNESNLVNTSNELMDTMPIPP